MPMTAVAATELLEEAGPICVEMLIADPGSRDGTLSGGDALCLMGRAALAAAKRHTNGQVVMVRAEDVRFHQPLPVGHILELTARVIHTDAHGMTILVDAMLQAQRGGRRTLALSGYFQMMAGANRAVMDFPHRSAI